MRTVLKSFAAGLIASFAFLALAAGPQGTRVQDSPFLAPLATTSGASYNWAGYVAEDGEYSAVSATWKVPTIPEGDGSLAGDATWVGIGGVENNDLLQAGTQGIAEDGAVRYEAWFERLPEASQPMPIAVHAGDEVTVSLVETSPAYWHVSFINNTTGKQYSFTTHYRSSKGSAEWVEEMPMLVWDGGSSSFLPLANFSEVVFRSARAVKDGESVTPQETGARPLAMHSYARAALALPSVLGADGASFSVRRTDAAPIAVRHSLEMLHQ